MRNLVLTGALGAALAGCAALEIPMPEPAPVMTWPELTARPRPEPSLTVRLGPAAWEVVDVWLPDGAGPHPAVIMVHGGCWRKAIADRTLMNYAAEDLRGRGLAVWNIEYRGVDEPGGGYPGTFQDVARAADALAAHGPSLGVNVDRPLAFGHSAGGHLALWLAARSRLPRDSALSTPNPIAIAAVVNSGGLADLAASAPVTAPSCLAEIFDALVGVNRPNPLADTSPAEMLPIGAYQLSVNTARDRIAPPQLGAAIAARARAAGDAAEAVVVPEEGHVELIAPGSAAFELQAQRLLSLAGLKTARRADAGTAPPP